MSDPKNPDAYLPIDTPLENLTIPQLGAVVMAFTRKNGPIPLLDGLMDTKKGQVLGIIGDESMNHSEMVEAVMQSQTSEKGLATMIDAAHILITKLSQSDNHNEIVEGLSSLIGFLLMHKLGDDQEFPEAWNADIRRLQTAFIWDFLNILQKLPPEKQKSISSYLLCGLFEE